MTYLIKCVIFCMIYYVTNHFIQVFIVDHTLRDRGLVEISPNSKKFPIRVLNVVLSITYPVNLCICILKISRYCLVLYHGQRNYQNLEIQMKEKRNDTILLPNKKVYTMVSVMILYQKDANTAKYATPCDNIYYVDGKKRYIDYPDALKRYEIVSYAYQHPCIQQELYFESKAYVAARMEVMGKNFYCQPTKEEKENILKLRDGILKQLKKNTVCEG